jgi:cyclopropane-fatty-acyl-phospholipid synthase
MSAVTQAALSWTEAGMVPDRIVRAGIRRLLEKRLRAIASHDVESAASRTREFVQMMDESPIALVPELANEQHYEVPAEFFTEVLGSRRKYSCCFWDDSTVELDAAEDAALQISVERAGIEDGMQILDLGCGWGSLSLWIAEHFPRSRVVSVSNSESQHALITRLAADRGLDNVEAHVADMNDFDPGKRFDRIVSVEMFEHMRNYRRLFRRVADWLQPDGKFFMHIFTHRGTPYTFDVNGPSDWMSRHFFSGGIMPSAELPLYFQDDLKIENTWRWNGRHYAATSNAWLQRMDDRRASVMPILAATYGDAEAERWWMRWRMFFMACAELFAWDDGNEWFVSHYLFSKEA